MAILTLSGRAAMAIAIKAQPIHLAWGSGDAAWDTVPVVETVDQIELIAEVGRRAATSVKFCVPDEAGEIIVPTGRFTEVTEPSNHLYMKFNFDFADSPSAEIREAGVFTGTQVIAGLPVGQTYFIPSEIQAPGILLALERFPKFSRSSAVRQSFEFVITI
jgi:hypothetical protein